MAREASVAQRAAAKAMEMMVVATEVRVGVLAVGVMVGDAATEKTEAAETAATMVG